MTLEPLRHIRHAAPLLFGHRLTEVTWFVTDVCNMKCRHCFAADALNRRSVQIGLEELAAMARHLPALQRVHLGGGEPFTRSDIAELATLVSNEWHAGVVCIPTNGWFTDRILAGLEHFGTHGKGHLRLHFSINSMDAEAMDAFTGLKGSLDRWRRSITEALALVRSYPHITIVALATYNEHNQDHFQALIDALHQEIGVTDFSFQLVRSHGQYNPTLDLAGFRAACNHYFDHWNQQNPLLNAFRRQIRLHSADYREQPGWQRRCTSGKLRLVMAPNGDLYPCEQLGYPDLVQMDAWRIGNIRDFGFDLQAAIDSPRARALYERICNDRCHCEHGIDQSLSLLTSPRFQAAVLASALGRGLHRPDTRPAD